MVGQRIVNLRAGNVRGQQLLDSAAVVLIMQHGPDVRALHDAGEEEFHGESQSTEN